LGIYSTRKRSSPISVARAISLGTVIVIMPAKGSAAIGGGGTVVLSTASASIYENVTLQTVDARTDSYSTRVIGVLVGRATVFDQTIAQSSTSPLFTQTVNAAGTAVSAAGAPLFVRLLPPRLIASSQTSSISSSSVDVIANPIPPSEDPYQYIVAHNDGVTSAVIGPVSFDQAVPNNYIGVCTAKGRQAVGADLGAVPSGCTGGAGTTLAVPAGAELVITNANYTENVTRTTTNTTNSLLNQTYEVDGLTARLGTIHAVVPVAGFDQAEAMQDRLLVGHAENDDHRFTPWVEGWGGWDRTRGRGDIPGDERNSRGIDGGFEYRLQSRLRLGVAIDTGRTQITLRSVGEHGRLNLTQIGGSLAFGGARGFYASLAGAFGWGRVSTSTSPIGADATSRAHYRVHSRWFAAEAGWRGQLGSIGIMPAVGIATSRISTAGFHETGSSFTLMSHGGSFTRNRAWAGVTAAVPLPFGNTHALTFSASARAVRFFGDLAPSLSAGFTGTGTTDLTIDAPPDRRWGVQLAGFLSLQLAPGAKAYAGYETLLSGGNRRQAVRAGVKFGF
jgi:uncharacterized protein with beta-barrel porin domain